MTRKSSNAGGINGATRVPLTVAGVVLALLIGAAALARQDAARTEVPVSRAIAERNLMFRDRADGAVAVLDAADGSLVRVVTGQAGFLRATVRGLAQQRRREDIGSADPFRLTAWADGRLTLDDPDTRRHIELEAFGGTNEAVFAELLPLPRATP